MNRRSFLALLGGTGLTALGNGTNACAAGTFPGHTNSNGVLHDTTLCIGCRKCEVACSKVNDLPKPEQSLEDLTVTHTKRRTTAAAWTVVNRYEQSDGTSVFRKLQCLHCEEPACASACFVKAFTKNPDGSVTYDPSLCVGCRYCMVACPFNIPGYTYDSAFNPLVQKCTLCHPRLEQGLLPGCVDACPTGALVYGKRKDLIRIAWDRINADKGRYQTHLYGEHEMGGTAWMILSGASFTNVGLDEKLGNQPAADYTKGLLGVVPMVVGIWPVLLGGAYAITKRKEQVAAEEQSIAVQQAVEATKTREGEKMAAERASLQKDQARAVEAEAKKVREEVEAELTARFAEEKATAEQEAATRESEMQAALDKALAELEKKKTQPVQAKGRVQAGKAGAKAAKPQAKKQDPAKAQDDADSTGGE